MVRFNKFNEGNFFSNVEQCKQVRAFSHLQKQLSPPWLQAEPTPCFEPVDDHLTV